VDLLSPIPPPAPQPDPEFQLQPWDRQPGESRKAFAAFVIYRDLPGTRGCLAAAQKVSCRLQIIRKWSATHDWYNRARAWDKRQDRLARQEQIRERQKMAERIAMGGKELQELAREEMQKLRADLRNGRPDPTDPKGKKTIAVRLTPYQIARMFELGARSERMARGDPDPDSANNYDKFELVISTNPPPVDDPEAYAAALALEEEMLKQG